jgi:hypothetical protein
VSHVGQDDLLGFFTDWEPDLQILIGVSHIASGLVASQLNSLMCKCIDHAMKWAIHTVKPLRCFVSERVALIGDAVSIRWAPAGFNLNDLQAHAEQPTQGAGAGQAIEV